jgi:dTDP-4-amino-4,6-dideoxygalactose transaminase
MKHLKMVNLFGQYQKIKSEIDTAIQEVIHSSAFINGPQVKSFRANLASYLGVKHVIPCANGTDALQIALMTLDLKPGDEVITPDFTFIATVEVVALLGLKPVLVDVDPDYFTLDTAQLKKSISSRTKAIIPVHLYGLCANMTEILEIAGNSNIPVIEDTAQALGADYHDASVAGKAGTLGTIGTTSFFPSKNLGCFGDGGAMITNNDTLAEKMSCIANHGAKVKYYHDEVGVNSRLDTLQAAILDVKLRYLDSFAQARRKAADYYTTSLAGIPGIKTPALPSYSNHVFHQYTLQVDGKRDELKEFLAKESIPTMIYYPVPMHSQKAFHIGGNFPVSDKLCKTVLSLPMDTEIKEKEQDFICERIKQFYN